MARQPLYEVEKINVIEFHMVDKKKYFPLTCVSGTVIRSLLHPVSLVKTRIQIQKHNTVYKGLLDAFCKIWKFEGVRGLYKGLWVANLQVFPSLVYISTYENVRMLLSNSTSPFLQDNKTKSFVGGMCASLLGQTLVVPIDVVSQHIMMMGGRAPPSGSKSKHLNPLNIPESAYSSAAARTRAVITAVYKRDGLVGYYKGYLASVAVFAPNSALWWFFYDIYQNMYAGVLPIWVPRLLIQVMAGPSAGVSAALFTNPLDIIRARIQVESSPFMQTARQLWAEERMGIFVKGLSARIVQSFTFSFLIILGYESLKRWSILDEYKHTVRW